MGALYTEPDSLKSVINGVTETVLLLERASLFVAMDDECVEKAFNAVDERTALQKQLHALMCDGFMWLSRERYRDSLATHRKYFSVCSKSYLGPYYISIGEGFLCQTNID